MKRQKAVLLAEGQTPGRADEDTNLVRLTGVLRANSRTSRSVRIRQPVRPSGSNTTIIEADKLRRQPFRERRRVLLVATDPGKARPTGLHRRHRRVIQGGLARTGPWGSRSAARYRSGHRAASRVRPRLLSRNSSRGPSISHHDKNNSFFTTTNRSGSLNIIHHVRPLGRSGWYNY